MDRRFELRQDRNEEGFTLIELLIVVAILAIVAGGMVLAYDGLETQARKSEASRDIASLDQSVRVFVNRTGDLPNTLDSLLATTPAAPIDGVTNTANVTPGDTTFVETLFEGMNDDADDVLDSGALGDVTPEKLLEYTLTAADVASLSAAGITRLRYIDLAGNADVCVVPCALAVPAANGTAAAVGAISQADIPSRMFDVPREGAGRNRGRGFSNTLAAGDVVAMWHPGPGGINLSKVGANPGDLQGTADDGAAAGTSDFDGAEYGVTADRLVVLGVGNSSSLYTVDATAIASANLANAPVYPDVAKNEYPRYNLLVNLGPSGAGFAKARLLGVVDSRGDFLDEELAEASGQKPL